MRDERRLERDDRGRFAHLAGDLDQLCSSMLTNSTSPQRSKRADVPPGLAKAGALVDLDRTLVERCDEQAHEGRSIALASEFEACAEEVEPEPLPGQVRPQAEPVLEHVVLRLEVEEPDQRAVVVADGEIALGIQHRLLVAVVEVVRRLVMPLLVIREIVWGHRRDLHGIAPTRATQRAAVSRASCGPPTMKPAASASPAPVESTTSVAIAGCSWPPTRIPRAPALHDSHLGLDVADCLPLALVAEDDVWTDPGERLAHRVAEARDVRPRREIDAHAGAVLARESGCAHGRAGDRRAHQRVAGQMQRVALEPFGIEVILAQFGRGATVRGHRAVAFRLHERDDDAGSLAAGPASSTPRASSSRRSIAPASSSACTATMRAAGSEVGCPGGDVRRLSAWSELRRGRGVVTRREP